jgi:DNA-binding transcriptional MerR regulator
MMAPMNTEARFSLADLARVVGVTPRTVRYYIVQGLLPGANEPGPAAWYDDRHASRLRLIRELQRQHLPLAEIRTRLAELGDDDVTELLASEASKPQTSESSALDYIRTILGAESASPPPEPQTARSLPRRMTLARPMASPPFVVWSIADLAAPSAPTTERSQWDRIALTNDIELHMRRPLSRLDNKRVERLITIARQVLGEDQP